MAADGAVPAVYHVEFGTYLVSDSPRCSLRIKNVGEVLPWVKLPIRVLWVSVQIQYGSEVVVQDRVDVEAAGDTCPTVRTSAGTLLWNLIGRKKAENTVCLSGTAPRRVSLAPGHTLGLPSSEC